MEEKLIHKLSVKIIPWQRNTTGNLSMQWRAAFNKLTNIFHTLYQVALVGSPTPTRTVCVPFSPSFSHSSWRLLVRRHAHPGQQRVRRRALLFHTQGPPGSLTHHLLLLKHIVIVCFFLPTVLQQGIIHPPLVGEAREHALCCLATLPAVKAAFAWEASVPLSREAVSSHAMCKSVKLLLCASARLCLSTSEPRRRTCLKIWGLKDMFPPQRKHWKWLLLCVYLNRQLYRCRLCIQQQHVVSVATCSA